MYQTSIQHVGSRSRLPRTPFRHVKNLDRYRKILLGLPIYPSHLDSPWGYEDEPDEEGLLQPIDEMYILLVKAKKYLTRGFNYNQTTDWFNANIGSYTEQIMTTKTLSYIMKHRQPFDEAALPRHEREKL